MDCGVDSAGDSSVQAFEEDSGIDSTVRLEHVDFSSLFNDFVVLPQRSDWIFIGFCSMIPILGFIAFHCFSIAYISRKIAM